MTRKEANKMAEASVFSCVYAGKLCFNSFRDEVVEALVMSYGINGGASVSFRF